MTSRCPKCGKNNYGDLKKCSFCGAPLVFIPGEEIPQISEEDVQAKLSTMSVDRIRNPVLIGGGGIVAVIGIFFAIILFLIFMLWIFNPAHVEPYIDQGSMHYDIPGGEEYIFGEITLIVKDGQDAQDQSYGYRANYFAVEIEGDGQDKRERADDDVNTALEPDVWVYTEDKFGDVGDTVLIKVKSERNDFGEIRAVNQGKAGWGGSGWFSGGWIFILPGFLMFLGGAAISTVGLIGKADRSMERLMEEDKEFRRQQLMLREAARKQMEVQQRQQQWISDGSGQPQPGQPAPMGEVQPQPAGFAPQGGIQPAPQAVPAQPPAAGYAAAPQAVPQVAQQFEAPPPQPVAAPQAAPQFQTPPPQPAPAPQSVPAPPPQNIPPQAPQVQMPGQPPQAPQE
jgi:hypothetical protein